MLVVSSFDVCERGSVSMFDLNKLLVVVFVSVCCSVGASLVCVLGGDSFSNLAPGGVFYILVVLCYFVLYC